MPAKCWECGEEKWPVPFYAAYFIIVFLSVILRYLGLFQGASGYPFQTICVELIFLIFNQNNISFNRLSAEVILKTHIECMCHIQC